jgi:hypothetical protein
MERIRPGTPIFETLYITKPEEVIRVEFREKEYQEAVQRLKEHYPQNGRRVYKTRKKLGNKYPKKCTTPSKN